MSSIFNNYKNNNISLYEAIKDLDVENESNDKKNEGVIYTPKHIADFIVANLGYNPTKTIIEPSVGHGVFIFSLINYVEKTFSLKGENLKEWFESKVYCFDINDKNIEDLKKLLTIYFNKKNIKNVSFNNFKISDTLFEDFKYTFDFSFGNPPYIRTKNLEEKYLSKLRKKYTSCKRGNIDIYYAFMELMNNISNVSSFIVPNSYIYNASAKFLREKIKDNLSSVIDFKSKLIFENARTYTSIYKTDKLNKNKSISYKEDLGNQSISIKKEELDNKHWVFSKNIIDNKGKNSIVDLYDCYGSIATLRDKLYLLESPEEIIEKNKAYYLKNHDGKKYKIEKGLCIDFYKITKMKKEYKLLYPYQNGKIIKEAEIKEKYPEGYSYLTAIKKELDQRDKGKVYKYESWFAYGRKQGLQEKNNVCYLFLPLMASKEYKCHKMKNKNNFMLSSGFVLGFDNEKEADKVKEILESGCFFDYIKTKGKPWAGKEPYYSFTKTHLRNFYI